MRKRKKFARPITTKRRKNQRLLKRVGEQKFKKFFYLNLAFSILCWLLIALEIFFIDPSSTFALPSFFLLTFVALYFTFCLFLTNKRHVLLATTGVTAFLILRYLGVGHVINFFLIIGLFVTAEIFFSKE